MKLGVRSKLFLVSLSLILAVAAVSGLFLERRLRTWLEGRIETELFHHAHSSRVLLQRTHDISSVRVVDPITDDLGEATGTRVTLILADGTVLGDSQIDLADVRAMENHADRPEIIAAREHGSGKSRRYSTTLRTHMLYVAVPLQHGGGVSVVRVATPLSQVDHAVTQLRVLLGVAFVLVTLLALVVAGISSHLLSSTFRRLVQDVRHLAEDHSTGKVTVASEDEIGWLASSFNQLRDDLERSVSQLAEERDRFEAVLEGMEAGVVALDDQLRITLLNSSAREMLGLEGESRGLTLLEAARLPALHDLMAHVREGVAASCEVEMPLVTPRHLMVRSTPQSATGGTILLVQDITQLRRLETIRQDFVANVSHELRTPVSVIQANAETLLDGAMEDARARGRFIEAIHRNAMRQSRIIADLLDLTSLEAGQLEFHLQPISLEQAVVSASDAIESTCNAKGTRLVVDFDPDLAAMADEKALDQVLVNLMDNAVKYTPDPGKITVRTRRDGDQVRIEIEDDGPGIAPQHRERIFERFYRVDKGRSREMGGTGLGLAIVKHLVARMGGRITVSPVDPHGSLFTVELIVADAHGND